MRYVRGMRAIYGLCMKRATYVYTRRLNTV